MKLGATVRRTGILGGLMLAGSTVGCDIVGPHCTTELVHGIEVQLRDQTTGELVTGRALKARAQSGSFQDTTSYATPDGRVFLVPERPGMYDVTIEVDGFREWTRADIVVRMDANRCHVVTERVVADLEPDQSVVNLRASEQVLHPAYRATVGVQ